MSGSIAERYLRAKTGTLNGVSCLSGFAGAPLSTAAAMRAPLAFAVLVNDHEDGAAAKRLQDHIVEALVAYQSIPAGLTAAPPAGPTPPGTGPGK